MKYEIVRNDDSFLEDAKLIDVSTFDFDSKEFKDAVDRSIRRQEEIDAIQNAPINWELTCNIWWV